jgi:hypothetical protein
MQIDAEINAGLERTLKPFAEARTLPGAVYTSAKEFAKLGEKILRPALSAGEARRGRQQAGEGCVRVRPSAQGGRHGHLGGLVTGRKGEYRAGVAAAAVGRPWG